MNNKKTIVAGIQKASESYTVWLEQTALLVKGKANHTVKKPMSHADCEFGMWFYSDGQQLNTLAGFEEIESLHQEFHQEYKAIFEGAEQVCDAESLSALKRHSSKLESVSNSIFKVLEKVQRAVESAKEANEPENSSNIKDIEKMINIDDKEVEIFVPDTPVQQAEQSSATDLRRKLKEQDLFQLQQEQELTELDLKQLEDRQKLTAQGIQQVAQYQTLKEQEINKQISDHEGLEEHNINAIYLGQQNLARIKEEILIKTDELEQLALVDEKLDQRKAEEDKKERRVLADFDKSQQLDKQDIVRLENQRKQWQDEAKKLKEQFELIEQDLVGLAEKLKTKHLIIDASNQKKEVKLQELSQHSKLQDKLNGHKIRVKEGKQGELNQLEQDKSTLQEDLRMLEIESATLENQKIEIKKSHKKELRQLEEQQRFKKMTIEKLEKDKGRKQQELKEIVHQQSNIQQSLDEIDRPKTVDASTKKNKEKA